MTDGWEVDANAVHAADACGDRNPFIAAPDPFGIAAISPDSAAAPEGPPETSWVSWSYALFTDPTWVCANPDIAVCAPTAVPNCPAFMFIGA